MLTSDGSSETLKLFEKFLQTSFNKHNPLTEDNTMNYFHSLLRGEEV